jgi:hypothetical protein
MTASMNQQENLCGTFTRHYHLTSINGMISLPASSCCGVIGIAAYCLALFRFIAVFA